MIRPARKTKRFRSNCLVVALVRGGIRMRAVRNKYGRLHWYRRDSEGKAWDFCANRGDTGYLQNVLYLGVVRRYPKLDADYVEVTPR